MSADTDPLIVMRLSEMESLLDRKLKEFLGVLQREEQESLVSATVVAKRCSVTAPTVRAWATKEGCPVHRPGGRVMRFRWEEVEAWLVTRDAA